MVRKTILLAVLIVTAFSLFGCETAKGLKGNVQFIGDKTYETLEK
ncbi:MAG: hypothetical protein ABIF19_02035 [Planctomycetota bacterium]